MYTVREGPACAKEMTVARFVNPPAQEDPLGREVGVLRFSEGRFAET
jgi:hypothetical protein